MVRFLAGERAETRESGSVGLQRIALSASIVNSRCEVIAHQLLEHIDGHCDEYKFDDKGQSSEYGIAGKVSCDQSDQGRHGGLLTSLESKYPVIYIRYPNLDLQLSLKFERAWACVVVGDGMACCIPAVLSQSCCLFRQLLRGALPT